MGHNNSNYGNIIAVTHSSRRMGLILIISRTLPNTCNYHYLGGTHSITQTVCKWFKGDKDKNKTNCETHFSN